MFASKEWQSSEFVKTSDGFVENLILEKYFELHEGYFPLIKVFYMVDSNENEIYF